MNLIQLTTQPSSTLVNQDPDGDSLFQNLSAKGKEKERERGFLQWYESDGIVLPHGSDENTAAAASEEEEEEEDHEEEEERWKFDELDAKIRNTINKYDGAVFPKLDWSAPRVSLMSELRRIAENHCKEREVIKSALGIRRWSAFLNFDAQQDISYSDGTFL